jgi:hypothetical protein
MMSKAKKWLNTRAVEQMTAERLAERDPKGEVLHIRPSFQRLPATGPPVFRCKVFKKSANRFLAGDRADNTETCDHDS